MKNSFLLEIGCEELPARHCQSILKQLSTDTITRLASAHNLVIENPAVWITPRRIAITAPAISQKKSSMEVKGPLYDVACTDGKPNDIAKKFAESHRLSIDQLEVKLFGDKKFLCISKDLSGSLTDDIQAFADEILPAISLERPMRWDKTGRKFSRPIRWIVCLTGSTVVPVHISTVTATANSVGPRFAGSPPVRISDAANYVNLMKKNTVIVDQEKRKTRIKEMLTDLAIKQHVTPVDPDNSLLDEVTHLVENPYLLMCSFEKSFLSLPPEVISTVLRNHQKYFPLKDAHTGDLTNSFIVVANYPCDSSVIRQGNETVVAARLRDGLFFFEQDLKKKLKQFAKETATITFQEKLGSMKDKTDRIEKTAQTLSAFCTADHKNLVLAARLSKADLATTMVNEFSSLEGTMGRIYAQKEGLPNDVSTALEECYLPRSASGTLPREMLGTILSLADRIDTIYGLFSLGYAPKGNSDPFGLRRAAISIARILWEKDLDIPLYELIHAAENVHTTRAKNDEITTFILQRLEQYIKDLPERGSIADTTNISAIIYNTEGIFSQKRDQYAELSKTSTTETFAQLLELAKRMYNIALKGNTAAEVLSTSQALNKSESALLAAATALEKKASLSINDLYTLIEPGTQFFEENMVMSEDIGKRKTRLALLQKSYAQIARVLSVEHFLK